MDKDIPSQCYRQTKLEITPETTFVELCVSAEKLTPSQALDMIERSRDMHLTLTIKQQQILIMIPLILTAPRRNVTGIMTELRQVLSRGIMLSNAEIKRVVQRSLKTMESGYAPSDILNALNLLQEFHVHFSPEEIKPVLLSALQDVWEQQGQQVFRQELALIQQAGCPLPPMELMFLTTQAQQKSPADVQRETRGSVTKNSSDIR